MYIYYLISFLSLPIYLIILCYRVIVGREDIKRILERFGIPSAENDFTHRIIWLHAASVGESFVAITLIDAISKLVDNDTKFLLTTGTKSSSVVLKSKLPATAVHQFLPIDNIIFVKKFLKFWKPQIGIFIESEIWPVIINEASKSSKLLLVNARLSDRSFKRWQKFKSFFKKIVSNFSEVLVQSDVDLRKFHALDIDRAINLGNIKFANKKLDTDETVYQKLHAVFRDRRIILFASTHKEDEERILNIIHPIKKSFPDSYFILVPRHPERAKDIADECRNLSLTFSLRQEGGPNVADDLYIINTFNELGLFYRLAYIAYVGGSFAQGGHNPIEAAHFDNVIIFGPDMSNCKETANSMISCNGAIQVKDEESLKETVERFLDKRNYRIAKNYMKNAKNIVDNQRQVLEGYLKIIKKYL
jgi:3-deoxy-D-manno-octulosonic-acid transferase